MNTDRIVYYLNELKEECKKGIEKRGPFANFHEAYAVILEEMEEMWEEIKKKKPFEKLIKEECVQVGAMCLKLLVCFFDEDGNFKPLEKD